MVDKVMLMQNKLLLYSLQYSMAAMLLHYNMLTLYNHMILSLHIVIYNQISTPTLQLYTAVSYLL